MVRGFSALVLMGASLAVVAAPQLKDKPGDNPLIGVWTQETVAFGGKVRPVLKGGRYEFTVDGKHIRGQGETRVEFPFNADAKANPKALDIGQFQGIYKLDGDRLTFAMPQYKQTLRPSGFETPKDEQVVLYVFKRVKP